jgi:hypothetical protein
MPCIRNAQIDLLKPNGGAHGEEHRDRRSSCVNLVPRLAGVRASRRRSQRPVEVSQLGELPDHRIIRFFGASRAEEVTRASAGGRRASRGFMIMSSHKICDGLLAAGAHTQA